MCDYTVLCQNKFLILPYFSLAITILSLWVRKHAAIQGSFLSIAIITALLTHSITSIALITIIGLGGFVFFTFHSKNRYLQIACGIISFIISITIFLHLMPGFKNLEILHNLKLTPSAIPYSFYLNFDKPLIGLFCLWFGSSFINTTTFSTQTIIRQTLLITLLAVITLSSLLLLTNYVNFEPKFLDVFYIWSLSNLIFTCLPEEVLFRGLIQQSLTNSLARLHYGKIIALVLTSILFGIIHFQGGIMYVIFCTIAGLFYGLAYLSTGRIESSIITHFLVNLTHFVFFTYPALQHNIPK